MYDELVKRLREDKSWVEQGTTDTEHEIAEHIQQAADAIEELSVVVRAQKAVIDKLAQQLRTGLFGKSETGGRGCF